MVKVIPSNSFEILFYFSNRYIHVTLISRSNSSTVYKNSYKLSGHDGFLSEGLSNFVNSIVDACNSLGSGAIWLDKRKIRYRGRSKLFVNRLIAKGISVHTIS